MQRLLWPLVFAATIAGLAQDSGFPDGAIVALAALTALIVYALVRFLA